MKSLLLLVTVLVSSTAWAQIPSFPGATGWSPLLRNGQPLTDPAGDAQGGSQSERDIVGDATHPAIYLHSDSAFIYLRMRVNGEVLKSGGTLEPFGWGCVIDTNADPTSYDVQIMLDGISNPDVVKYMWNQTPGPQDSLSDVAEVTLATYAATTHARQSAADSSMGGNPDFFIDFAVPWSVLVAPGMGAPSVPMGTPLRLTCGTSSNASRLSADVVGTGTTFSGTASDAQSCSENGCTDCRVATACGQSCSACGGSTPVCNTVTSSCAQCVAHTDCPSGASCTQGACTIEAPVISSPASGGTINRTSPTITGTSAAGATITVSVDGAPVGTTVAEAGGSWSFTVPLALTLGAHSFAATASVSGAISVTSTSSATNTVEIVSGCLSDSDCDGGTPRCATGSRSCVRCLSSADCPSSATCAAQLCAVEAPVITSPSADAATNQATPTVTGTSAPNATVTVWLDGAAIGTTLADGSGAWFFTPSSPLTIGSHQLTATATVGSGALAVTSPVGETRTFDLVSGCVAHIDCAGGAPRCETTSHTCVRCLTTADCPTGACCQTNSCVLAAPTVTGPTTGGVTNDSTPTITGTAAAGATVTVRIDGVVAGTTVADGNGTFSFSVAAPLSPGVHTLVTTATVGAGGEAITSAPDGGSTFQIVDGCVRDADCAEGAPRCVDSTHACVRCLTSADCPAGAACSGHACVVTPPTIASPAPGAALNDATPTITGTAPPGATVTIATGGVMLGTTVADGAGGWSFTPLSSLTPGPHSFTATASLGSGAGAVSSGASAASTVQLVSGCLQDVECGGGTPRCRIDTHACVRCLDGADCPAGTSCDGHSCTAPAPVVTSGTSSLGSGAPPTWTGSAAPGAVVILTLDGAIVGMTTADMTGGWVFTAPMALVPGAHTLTVVATVGTAPLDVSSPPAMVTLQVHTGCTADASCGANTPRCNLATQLCVRCLSSADCPSGATCQDDVCRLAAPVVTAPTSGGLTNLGAPTIFGIAVAGASVVVSIDGSVVGTTVADAMGAWSFTPNTPLAVGSHTVNVTTTVGEGALAVSAGSAASSFEIVTGCLADADCAGSNTRCRAETRACVRCLENAHCPSGATCQDHVCQLASPAIDPPPGGNTTSSAQPTISGTAAPGAHLVITIDGTFAGVTTANQAGIWTFTPSASLAPGPHLFGVSAAVGEGAQVITSPAAPPVTLTVAAGCAGDGSCGGATPYCRLEVGLCVACRTTTDCAPGSSCGDGVCTLASPVVTGPDAGAITNDQTPTFTGTAAPGASVTILVDGIPATSIVANGEGQWSWTPATSLPPGPHVVTALASLTTGGQAAQSPIGAPQSFTVVAGCLLASDCGAARPVCDLASHACVRCLQAGDCPTGASCVDHACVVPPPVVAAPAASASAAPLLTGSAPAGAQVTVSVDGAVVGTTTADAQGSWSLTPPAPLGPGAHTVSAIATVGSGPGAVTTTTSTPVTFTVQPGCASNAACVAPTGICDRNSGLCVRCLEDGHCPFGARCEARSCRLASPVIVSPQADAALATGLVIVRGTAAPNATVTITIDGAIAGMATADATGAWAFTLTTPLSAGPHVITASAVVGQGSVAVASPASAGTPFATAAPDDLDGDGLTDTVERQRGTDPADADSDDDGVLDGDEQKPWDDSDGDGAVNALDADSDGDGVLDGTEQGIVAPHKDTNVARGRYIPDADPSTVTDPTRVDSDGDGRSDGDEDGNKDGRHDPGERNPTAVEPPPAVPCATDAACGGQDSGMVCDASTGSCRTGCRRAHGNGCPVSAVCMLQGGDVGLCDTSRRTAFAGGGLSCALGRGDSPSGWWWLCPLLLLLLRKRQATRSCSRHHQSRTNRLQMRDQ